MEDRYAETRDEIHCLSSIVPRLSSVVSRLSSLVPLLLGIRSAPWALIKYEH